MQNLHQFTSPPSTLGTKEESCQGILPLHLCSKSYEYQSMPGFYEEAVLSCHRNTEALSEDKEEVDPQVVGLQARLPPPSRELPSAASVL